MPRINWPNFQRAYVPLFCAGLTGMYLKFSLIERYWIGIARSHGVQQLREMPLLTIAGYFSLDIIANFLVIPAVALLLVYALAIRRAHIAVTLLSCGLVAFYFVQLWAQQNLGQYLSFTMLLEGVRFARTDWRMAADYVSAAFALKLVFALVVTAISSIAIAKLAVMPLMKRAGNAGNISLGAIPVLFVVLAIAAYPANPNGLRQDAVRKAVSVAFSSTPDSTRTRVSADESVLAFRQLTATPTGIADSNMAGAEAGANLLYFVMETGPADVLPDDGDPAELIPVDLKQNMLVARQHQTTYPYTSDALFSILTGFYPEGRREIVARGGFKQHRPLFSQLQAMGYSTAAYLPVIAQGEADDKMLGQFGMGKVFVAQQHQQIESPESRRTLDEATKLFVDIVRSSPHFDNARKDWMMWRLWNDLRCLDEMKTDMRTALRSGKKFAHVYLPLIGHGPWLRVGSSIEVRTHGRFLMKLQSLWLKQVVDLLREEKALGNTVIVLTADHGIRSAREDPDFKAGTIDSYSFHVPLMMYAPRAFKSPVEIQRVTSHIDIEASVARLLGTSAGPGNTQGYPLWGDADARRVYFFAESYGGADGFHQREYFMRNAITENYFRNSRMDFSAPGSQILDTHKQDEVAKALTDFRRIHRSLVLEL